MGHPITTLKPGDLIGVEGYTCWKVTKVYPDGRYNLSSFKTRAVLRKVPLLYLRMMFVFLDNQTPPKRARDAGAAG